MRGGDGAVDQQRLGRAADAGAAHLGVDGDLHRHVEIGRAVDIEMADAFEMGEDRHPRLALHAPDQAFAAARNDHVEIAVEAVQHLADGGAVGGRHQLDGIFRQAGRLQPFDQAGMDGGGRIERIRAAAQDHRIAGLEAERAGIRRHVRPALIDDADDAERRAHALDMQAVRPVPCGDDLADRIAAVRRSRGCRRPWRGCAPGQLQPVHEGRRTARLPRHSRGRWRWRRECPARGAMIASAMATSAAFLRFGRWRWPAVARRRAPCGRSRPSALRCHRRIVHAASAWLILRFFAFVRCRADLVTGSLTTRSSRWTIAERAS